MDNRIAAPLGVLLFSLAPAGAQTQLWIRQVGTGAGEWVNALAVDGAGGAFVAGQAYGNLFGPSAGASDAFLARYNQAGGQLWGRQRGTGSYDAAISLAPDSAGGAFVAGWTSGSLFEPNPGLADAWLARYDGGGILIWGRQFGTSSADWGAALAPDGAGGAYIAGRTDGDLGGPSAGLSDAWLARYDSAGNQTWIGQFGTGGADQAWALAPDGAGGVYIAGRTDGNLGGSPAGGADAWLARYDGAGNRTWIRQFGTGGGDSAAALAPDGAGGVFVSGWCGATLFGPHAGNDDAFIARYDGAGKVLWGQQVGTGGGDWAAALAPDGTSGVFVAGYTTGGLGASFAGGSVYGDAWLAHYDGGGSRAWIRQLGTPDNDAAFGLAADNTGGAFVAGSTEGDLAGPNAGITDAWLARYTDACYPDCNADGSLTVADFGCFQTEFVVADPYADCNADGQHTVADFGCFQTRFVAGCP